MNAARRPRLHPVWFGVGPDGSDTKRFDWRCVAGAIYGAPGDVSYLTASGAQSFEQLHPLHVSAVTIGMRKHLVDGEDA
jgi:hypothetical protein